MNITPNFSLEEFSFSSVAVEKGIDNTIPIAVQPAIVYLCAALLQPLRSLYGKPLHINSGYRCQALNKAVGGVPTSQHTKGEAADVACSSPKKLLEVLLASSLAFDQAILYPTFLHLSCRKTNNRHQIVQGGRVR